MNGSDRLGAIITVCLLAAFVAFLLVVSSCTLQESKIDAPTDLLEAKSAHILQSRCIDAHGDWDSQYKKCEFKK